MSKDEIICVDCPHCGHTNQKSFMTHSVIVCEACKKPYWSLVDEGFYLSAKLDNKSKVHPDIDKMRRYLSKVSAMVQDE